MGRMDPLEHALWRDLQKHDLKSRQFCLLVSGGIDSVALLCAFVQVLKNKSGQQLRVFHFNHGPGPNQKFRLRSENYVKRLCLKWGIPFVSAKSAQILKSEAEMRSGRLSALRNILGRNEIPVSAHHIDDLLETRIIRLIRGTGVDGLESMRVWNAEIFRPFLSTTKQQLENYLKEKKIRCVQDPSNKSNIPLRNWLRNVWLPGLEKKRPGALKNFNQSLQLIVESIEDQNKFALKVENPLPMKNIAFVQMQDREQRQWIRNFAQTLETNLSLSQVREVQRQLDKTPNSHTFVTGPLLWRINAGQITAEVSSKGR